MSYQFSGNTLEAGLNFVGANAEYEIEAQPMFAKEMGLKPHHKFLDLACGCLRGTVRLVDYLDHGNFYGADVSERLLELANERCREEKVKNWPFLFLMRNFDDLRQLPKMDFILSVSLLTHLFPADLGPLFRNVAAILNPDGVYYFTMYPTTDHAEFDGTDMAARHNKQSIIRAGAENGLVVDELEGDFPSPVPSNQFLSRVNHPLMAQWVMRARPA